MYSEYEKTCIWYNKVVHDTTLASTKQQNPMAPHINANLALLLNRPVCFLSPAILNALEMREWRKTDDTRCRSQFGRVI